MRRGSALALVSSLALVACEPTAECVRLAEAVDEAEAALEKVQTRASMRKRAEDAKVAAETKAEKVLTAYGLDLPEAAITKLFEERAARHEGVSVVRDTKQTAAGPEGQAGAFETVWRFSISRRPLDTVFGLLDELAGSPPITRLSLFQRRPAGGYDLELTRITLPEVPITPQPAAMPTLPDVASIPKEFGFCGASGLRDRVRQIQAEMEQLEPDANATTVALPLGSTWDAKRIRAQQKGALERGGRSVFAQALRAVAESGVLLRAAGIDDSVVIIELEGSKARVKKRFAAALPKDVAARLESLPSPDEKLQRFTLPNPAFERMKPPGQGGGGLGGLPPPEKIREHFDHEGHE